MTGRHIRRSRGSDVVSSGTYVPTFSVMASYNVDVYFMLPSAATTVRV